MLKVIEHLEGLSTSKIKPMIPTEGLYYELKQLFGSECMMEVAEHAKKWEHFSGNFLHPIQCPYGGDAEQRFFNTNKLWAKTTYSRYRRDLCWFLAQSLRERYGY